jgi:decaprenylphospho-beta-D-ribofuranose 2-oxidase
VADPATPTLLTGWGRTAPSAAHLRPARTVDEVAAAVRDAPPRGIIARGLGRSYNDAAQVAGGEVLDLTALTGAPVAEPDGTVTAPAGVSFDRLLHVLAPRGLTLPVSPGTRAVTLGGALAADVHGKDHHVRGSFADHVTAFTLVTADGRPRRVTRDHDPELFAATAGGMGLTGVVVEVTFRPSPIDSTWFAVDTDRATHLDAVLSLLGSGPSASTHDVAWLDATATGAALGRGVVTRARAATRQEVLAAGVAPDPLALPPDRVVPAPPWVPRRTVNAAAVRAFNELRYRRAPIARRDELRPLKSFLHPLDAVTGWNRLHGRDGLVQYQFVVPLEATGVVHEVLRASVAGPAPVALAVLKRLGPGNGGLLSFPAEGWTLALDLPNVRGVGPLLDALDERVVAAGGRVYLAKDARVDARHLPAMYPGVERFRALRRDLDPTGRFTSDLARRLQL